MARPLRLEWRFRTAASPRAAWDILSDTDRFNRVARVGFSYRSVPQPDGSVRHIGSTTRFGLENRWEEIPIRFQAPDWYEIERNFESGLVRSITTTLRISRAADGMTDILYANTIQPRGRLAAPLVRIEVETNLRRNLNNALERAMALIEGGDPQQYDAPPPPLVAAQEERLATGLGYLEPSVASVIGQLIRTSPLREQQCIRPLEVANASRLSPRDVIAGCLGAVTGGALEMQWDLLCPSCRAASTRLQTLAPGEMTPHCSTCNIQYDASLPDAIEVTFRPSRAVRDFEVQTQCLLSPAHTPHVLANQKLPPGEEIQIRIELEPDGYSLEAPGIPGTCSLEVREGIRTHSLTLDLTARGLVPPITRAGPGSVLITVRSRLGEPALVSLARRFRPPFALTAGRLLETPGARALIPTEALAPGIRVRVESGVLAVFSLLAPGAKKRVVAVLEKSNPSLQVVDDELAIGLWREGSWAISAAEALSGDARVATVLTAGQVVLLESQRSLFGGTLVDRALAVARRAGPGQVLIAERDLSAPLLRDVLETWQDRASVTPKGPLRRLLFRDARPAPPPKTATTELESIGGFTVIRKIGEGGFGAVYLARHPDFADDVVIKVLLPEWTSDPMHAQRFFNEARLAASLHHVNIVAVHDWGQTPDGTLYMVMEHLVGQELEAVFESGPVEPSAMVDYARQMLSGLGAAHQAGFIHRDIKPSNVFLLTKGGRVKLIDFGIARSSEDAELDAGLILGTPRYMAPEQVEGSDLDVRTDLYQVGLVLYEGLTGGAFPFTAATPQALAIIRLKKPPLPLQSAAPSLDPTLTTTVMRALSRDPAGRFPDAETMRRALLED